MSRMQIPIDVFASRMNLSDRLAGVRSQSLASRFANIRPLSDFFDFKRLSKPANFSEVQSRVNYNLSHFSSNYAVVVVMLSVYSLLTNFLLLFVILLVVGGMWGIGRLEGRDLEIGALKASSSQLYTGLICIAIPLGFLASPISAILWLIGASGVTILGHASFMDKPIDEAFSGEASYEKNDHFEKKLAIWDGNLYNRIGSTKLDSEDTDLQRGKDISEEPLQSTISERVSTPFGSLNLNELVELSSSDGSESDSSSLEPIEKLLAQLALVRIRRARQKGKKYVKLNNEEIAALEKRRKVLHANFEVNDKKKIEICDNREDQTYNGIAVPISSQFISDQFKSIRQSEKSPEFNEHLNIRNPSLHASQYSPSFVPQIISSEEKISPLYKSVNNHLSSTSRPIIGNRNHSHELQTLSSRGHSHYSAHGNHSRVGSNDRFIPHLDSSQFQANSKNPYTSTFQSLPYKYPVSYDSTHSPIQSISAESYLNPTASRLRWRGRDDKDELSL
ncbi:prenylated Rab acceptor 1 [Erysiphe neolycopersici]|uniref:Prenylated Rab acceptor 1 n=1 Tax=Erysiphe neolycopersici TaxID=212602 RepID=A0A420HBK4_9PEZI|nr:prenylated Rab acceptor 1 [Erysiphe neolycopersici]